MNFTKADDTFIHNSTTINNLNLKKGDLIEFDRGVYSHWAVYLGNWMVVHLAGDGNDGLNANSQPEHLFSIAGKQFNKAKVCVDKLLDVVLGSKISINNSKDNKLRPLHPDEIVKNALSKIGSVGYSVMTSNCEHFAKWCRYGVAISDQVDNAMMGLGVGAAGAAFIGLVYGMSNNCNPNQAQTEDDE